MPSRDEVRGWSRLLATGSERLLLRAVQDMHTTISDRAYRWVGPVGAPVKVVSDTVTAGVYGAIGVTLRAAGTAGAAAADRLVAPSDAASPVAVKARAIVNGAVDGELLEVAPELQLALTFRRDGVDVAPERASLAAAYPDASPRIAVFLHGLMDTDAVWSARAQQGVVLPDLAAGLGFTPVLVRYPTGRPIGQNAADLAVALDALIDAWPVTVDALVIVGHSMGGLVTRSACHTAASDGHVWPQVLTDIVYLGSPHLGSWLEKTANIGTWALQATSTRSAPIGALIDERSRGIKDLRFGMLDADGWGDADPDGLLTGRVDDEPWCDGITHHLIVGRLREPARHPLNIALGDSLVREPSASGLGRWRRIVGGGEVVVVQIASGHNALVRDAEVADVLRGVLVRR